MRTVVVGFGGFGGEVVRTLVRQARSLELFEDIGDSTSIILASNTRSTEDEMVVYAQQCGRFSEVGRETSTVFCREMERLLSSEGGLNPWGLTIAFVLDDKIEDVELVEALNCLDTIKDHYNVNLVLLVRVDVPDGRGARHIVSTVEQWRSMSKRLNRTSVNIFLANNNRQTNILSNVGIVQQFSIFLELLIFERATESTDLRYALFSSKYDVSSFLCFLSEHRGIAIQQSVCAVLGVKILELIIGNEQQRRSEQIEKGNTYASTQEYLKIIEYAKIRSSKFRLEVEEHLEQEIYVSLRQIKVALRENLVDEESFWQTLGNDVDRIIVELESYVKNKAEVIEDEIQSKSEKLSVQLHQSIMDDLCRAENRSSIIELQTIVENISQQIQDVNLSRGELSERKSPSKFLEHHSTTSLRNVTLKGQNRILEEPSASRLMVGIFVSLLILMIPVLLGFMPAILEYFSISERFYLRVIYSIFIVLTVVIPIILWMVLSYLLPWRNTINLNSIINPAFINRVVKIVVRDPDSILNDLDHEIRRRLQDLEQKIVVSLQMSLGNSQSYLTSLAKQSNWLHSQLDTIAAATFLQKKHDIYAPSDDFLERGDFANLTREFREKRREIEEALGMIGREPEHVLYGLLKQKRWLPISEDIRKTDNFESLLDPTKLLGAIRVDLFGEEVKEPAIDQTDINTSINGVFHDKLVAGFPTPQIGQGFFVCPRYMKPLLEGYNIKIIEGREDSTRIYFVKLKSSK